MLCFSEIFPIHIPPYILTLESQFSHFSSINVDISIKGSGHTPPSYLKVYDRMKKYFDTIYDSANDLYYNIAFSHLQLAKIHPFLDGNGRLARIVLYYQLKKNGLKPIIISVDNKEAYFNLLEEFKVNKNIEPFIDFIKSAQ